MVQWQTAGLVIHMVGSTIPQYVHEHTNTHAAVFELISDITSFVLGRVLVSVSNKYNFIFNLFKLMCMCVKLS